MEEVKQQDSIESKIQNLYIPSKDFIIPQELKQGLENDLQFTQNENQLKKKQNEEKMKEKDIEKKKIIEENYKQQLKLIKEQIEGNDSKVKQQITEALQSFAKTENQQLFRFPLVKGIYKNHIENTSKQLKLYAHQDSKSKQIIVQFFDYSAELKEEQAEREKIQQKQLEEEIKKQELEKKKQLKQQLENFKCQPDPVKQIIVSKIFKEKNSQQYVYEIEIIPPESNNSNITEYILYMFDRHVTNDFIKYQTFSSNLISLKVANLSNIFSFKITAVNQIGESDLKDAKIFKLKGNNFIKGQVLMCGFGDWNQFDQQYFEKLPEIKTKFFDEQKQIFFGFVPIQSFGNIINKVALQKCCLQLSDDGLVTQQGKSYVHRYSETENEIPVDKIEDSVDTIFSDVFLRFSQQTPETKILVANIATGMDFSVCTTVQGYVFTWGQNTNGQLGLGDRNFRIFPTQIKKELENQFIVDISASNSHVLALNDDGQVFVWGQGQAITGDAIFDSYGNVCDFVNSGDNQYNPRHCKEILGYYKIIKISAGWEHNAVISDKNELFTWGSNSNGKLGLGDITYKQSNAKSISLPRKVEFFIENKLRVTNVQCGKKHTLALVNDENNKIQGQLWAWGSSKNGQCGHQDMGSRIQPALVQAVKNEEFLQIAAGSNHSLAVNNKNELFGFGKTSDGALGKQFNGYQNLMIPQKLNQSINELQDQKKKIISITAAENISAILIA